MLNYENNTRDRIIHALATDRPNVLQKCILLGASYVKRVVEQYSMQPDLPGCYTTNFLALIIIQAMIMTKSQVPICGWKDIVEVSIHQRRK